MINLHEILKNPLCVTIDILTNFFGVEAKIYRPISNESIYSIEDFNTNNYEKIPVFEGTLLFTNLSGATPQTLNTYFNNFEFEDNSVYPKCFLEPLPINTLITIRVKDVEQVSNFIISETREYVYNGNKILMYYKVLPLIDRVVSHEANDLNFNKEELNNIATNKEIEALKDKQHSTVTLHKETIENNFIEEDNPKNLKWKRFNNFIEIEEEKLND